MIKEDQEVEPDFEWRPSVSNHC